MNNRHTGARRTVVAVALGAVVVIGACSDGASGPPTQTSGSPATGDDRVPVASGPTSTPGSSTSSTIARAPRRSGTRGLADGWNVVAPASERYTNDFDALLHDFGQDTGVAFGAGGAPVVVWASLTDSANNGYTLSASTYSGTAGWSSPVEVVRSRLAPGPRGRLFSIGGDAREGVVAVAFERHDDNGASVGVDVMLSTDAGSSWVRAPAVEGEAYKPNVIVSGGSVHVAYVGADGYVVASSTLPERADPDLLAPIDVRRLTWRTQPIPMIEGFGSIDAMPAVAASPDGNPAFAVLAASMTGNRRGAVFAPLGASSSVRAMEIADVTPGSASISVAYRGDAPVVTVAFEPRPNADALAYVATSNDGGSSFSSPVLVPAELRENAPFGVAMTILGTTEAAEDGDDTNSTSRTSESAPGTTATARRPGRIVLLYEPDTLDTTASGCGLPRMVSSEDLQTWTTCGAGDDTVTPATAVLPANLAPTPVAGPDGHLYVAITNRNPSARVPLGIVLWRG